MLLSINSVRPIIVPHISNFSSYAVQQMVRNSFNYFVGIVNFGSIDFSNKNDF